MILKNNKCSTVMPKITKENDYIFNKKNIKRTILPFHFEIKHNIILTFL